MVNVDALCTGHKILQRRLRHNDSDAEYTVGSVYLCYHVFLPHIAVIVVIDVWVVFRMDVYSNFLGLLSLLSVLSLLSMLGLLSLLSLLIFVVGFKSAKGELAYQHIASNWGGRTKVCCSRLKQRCRA